MTATNHAITGAVIALAIKKPELAIPLAFLSHFVIDAIPHYNPPHIHARQGHNAETTWERKFADPAFVGIFFGDMILLLIFLAICLVLGTADVSRWTIVFSALAAISPDFVGGRVLIYKYIGIKRKNPNKKSLFTRFHNWIQWMDRPSGIIIEFAWFFIMVWLIRVLR